MTDNELTARIGRELFDVTVRPDSSHAGCPFEMTIEGRRECWYFVMPTDEDLGESLCDHAYAFATDPRWIGPIIIAAAGKGIEVSIHSWNDPTFGVTYFFVAGCGDDNTRCEAADLPRTLCRAILAAAGEEVDGE